MAVCALKRLSCSLTLLDIFSFWAGSDAWVDAATALLDILSSWTGSDSWVQVASALLIPLEFVPLRVVPLDSVPLDVKPSSLSHFSVENINICFCKQWKFGFSTTQLVRVCSQSRFPAAPLGDRWNPTFSIFFFKAIFLLSLYAPLDSHESNPWLITDENLAQNTCAPW